MRRQRSRGGPTIEEVLAPRGKALFVLAHQDDELAYGGLLQRLGNAAHILWVTNSDGLAPEAGADPAAYGELRVAEGFRAGEEAGVARDRMRCLGFGEIEIYDRFVDVVKGERGRAFDHFRGIDRQVTEAVVDIGPDRIFTGAFQGGHPEHDLVHVFAWRAALELARSRGGRAVPFLQLPEYEFTNLVALRFKPWYVGEVFAIELTEEELARKLRMMECYPSQKGLFERFRRVIDAVGLAGRLVGRGTTADRYFARETFGPLPPGFDHARSTHLFDFLDYMFEEHRGTRIRFATAIRPIVRALG